MMKALKRYEALAPWTGGEIIEPAKEYPHRPTRGYRFPRRLSMLGLTAPDTVVIHATAGGNSAGAMSVMAAGKASWTYLVPDEDEAAHGEHAWWCVPESAAAWHVLSKVLQPRRREASGAADAPGN